MNTNLALDQPDEDPVTLQTYLGKLRQSSRMIYVNFNWNMSYKSGNIVIQTWVGMEYSRDYGRERLARTRSALIKIATGPSCLYQIT